MLVLLQIVIGILLLYLLTTIAYLLFLSCSYFFKRELKLIDNNENIWNKFAIIVPAYNEEILIAGLCENLLEINYPSELIQIYILADNCTDKTVEICSNFPVNLLIRNDLNFKGKGYALQWALSRINLPDVDAVFVLDADTKVDPDILHELNLLLNQGESVLQCYIELPNREESWLTELIYISRTINNLLYHYSKWKIGLSAYLMGTGMCFKSKLLQNIQWKAFSLSEDWEYYAQLVSSGVKIGFAKNAVVKQLESRSIQQATSQRLRWSSGRFYVVKQLGLSLFFKGIRERNWMVIDSSLALIFPNMSLLVNLSLISFLLLLFIPNSPFKVIGISLSFLIFCGIFIILVSGMYLAGKYLNTMKAIFISPLFLIWKLLIDFVCFTGIYKGKEWIRTRRHKPKN